METLRLIDTKEAAKLLGITPRRLHSWRTLTRKKGQQYGPKFLYDPHLQLVMYRVEDLREWERAYSSGVPALAPAEA